VTADEERLVRHALVILALLVTVLTVAFVVTAIVLCDVKDHAAVLERKATP
jgi:hypothetical protein